MADETSESPPQAPPPGLLDRNWQRVRAVQYAKPGLRSLPAYAEVGWGNTVDTAGTLISNPLLNMLAGAAAGTIRGLAAGAAVVAGCALAGIAFPTALTAATVALGVVALHGALKGYNSAMRSQYRQMGINYADNVASRALGGNVKQLAKQAETERRQGKTALYRAAENSGFVVPETAVQGMEPTRNWGAHVKGTPESKAASLPVFGDHTLREQKRLADAGQSMELK